MIKHYLFLEKPSEREENNFLIKQNLEEGCGALGFVKKYLEFGNSASFKISSCLGEVVEKIRLIPFNVQSQDEPTDLRAKILFPEEFSDLYNLTKRNSIKVLLKGGYYLDSSIRGELHKLDEENYIFLSQDYLNRLE